MRIMTFIFLSLFLTPVSFAGEKHTPAEHRDYMRDIRDSNFDEMRVLVRMERMREARAAKKKKAKKKTKKSNVVLVENKVCPMDGKPVSGKHYIVHDGFKYNVCSSHCANQFNKNYGDKVVNVNNKICPVCKMKTEGKYSVTYDGKKYNLACDGCDKEFLSNPQKYINIVKKNEFNK